MSILLVSNILMYVGVECGTLETIANGRVEFDATTFPSVANYSCDVGFTLLGVSQRACQAEATWSGQEPVCQGTSKHTYKQHNFD